MTTDERTNEDRIDATRRTRRRPRTTLLSYPPSLFSYFALFAVLKSEALAHMSFILQGLSNFSSLVEGLFSSNPRRQSKNIDMKYKTHIIYGTRLKLSYSRLKSSYEFHFEGFSNFSSLVERKKERKEGREWRPRNERRPNRCNTTN
jgi:hypothetical protein